MPKFDAPLHNDAVALICDTDRFTPEGWRAWLQGNVESATLNMIVWQGNPHDFASNLVTRLSHSQLVAALTDLRKDGGIQWQERIDALCRRIEEHTLAPIVNGQPNALLKTYHERCQAQWQNEPYVLQERFVKLLLLPRDDGESGGTKGRLECDDLRVLLTQTPEPIMLILGTPGGGKSTLLRRLHWDVAGDCLAQPTNDRITFFAPLNRYRVEDTKPLQWLAERWTEFAPDLPELDKLLEGGRMLLLLDGLNEMRCSSPRDFQTKVEQWQEFLSTIASLGNRVVFTCRARDYLATLESESAPLAIADVQPMSGELIRQFLDKYIPAHAKRVFEQIDADDKLRELYGTPYFLSLLIPQVGLDGDIPPTRARLFTGFVRHALREELKRVTRLIATDAELLHERDMPDLNAGTSAPYWLPRGLLITRLNALAFEMQQRYKASGAQVAFDLDEASPILGERADDLIAAGRHIKILDEISGSGQIKFFHQLLQEYFAARTLARQPERAPALVALPWRADEVEQSADAWLASAGQSPRSMLPKLPTSGWEETARMAAEMTADPEAFVRALLPAHLPLAGECAAVLGERLPKTARAELCWALVHRSQDLQADLRARILAGLALGPLGDPRFAKRTTRDGKRPVLLPPLVTISGGTYTIGTAEGGYDDEKPAHPVEIAPFAMSAFAVTNAEFKCFLDDGGYTTDEWWDTPAALAWRKGEADPQALIDDYSAQLRRQADGSEDDIRARYADDPDYADTLITFKTMSGEQFADVIRQVVGVGQPVTKPSFWDDPNDNNPSQPVVGVCWYEARAYCNWLRVHSGQPFRLPTEAEWEAATRGYPQPLKGSKTGAGRTYAYEGEFDPARANTLESRIRVTTPVGVYPNGATPTTPWAGSDSPLDGTSSPEEAGGIYDLTGNVWQWTSSLYVKYDDDNVADREDPQSEDNRVLRGGSWLNASSYARAAFRFVDHPSNRYFSSGFRLVVSAPVP